MAYMSQYEVFSTESSVVVDTTGKSYNTSVHLLQIQATRNALQLTFSSHTLPYAPNYHVHPQAFSFDPPYQPQAYAPRPIPFCTTFLLWKQRSVMPTGSNFASTCHLLFLDASKDQPTNLSASGVVHPVISHFKSYDPQNISPPPHSSMVE